MCPLDTTLLQVILPASLAQLGRLRSLHLSVLTCPGVLISGGGMTQLTQLELCNLTSKAEADMVAAAYRHLEAAGQLASTLETPDGLPTVWVGGQ